MIRPLAVLPLLGLLAACAADGSTSDSVISVEPPEDLAVAQRTPQPEAKPVLPPTPAERPGSRVSAAIGQTQAQPVGDKTTRRRRNGPPPADLAQAATPESPPLSEAPASAPAAGENSEEDPFKTSKIRLLEISPDKLIGLNPVEAVDLLGEPTHKEQDPPAQIWRYQGRACSLRLIFFPDMITTRYKSLSVQFQDTEAEDVDAQRRCLSALIAERRS